MFFQNFEKKINFEIWDTAGTEKYRSITRAFYNRNFFFIQGAEIAIFVYDITQKKTFKEIKNYWIKEIKLFSKQNVGKYKIYMI